MQQKVKSLLQNEKILKNLTFVSFHHVYRKITSLKNKFSIIAKKSTLSKKKNSSFKLITWVFNRTESIKILFLIINFEILFFQLITSLFNTTSSIQIIFVIMNFERLFCNENELNEFFIFWPKKKSLELQILISKNVKFWIFKSTSWNSANWIESHCDRYWAFLSFKNLIDSMNDVDNCSFAAQYVKQLRACERFRERVAMRYIKKNALIEW